MRRAGLVAILLALAATASQGRQEKRAPVPVESLVEAADAILVGAASAIAEGRATLTVESVVWGPGVLPGERLRVEWEVDGGRGCGHDSGWFVRARPRGVFLLVRGEGDAWTPMDVRPQGELPVIERALLERPVRVRIEGRWHRDDEAIEAVVRFRNASSAPIEIPEVRVEAGRLFLGEGAVLAGRFEPGNNAWADLPPREGAIVRTTGRCTVRAHSEVETRFDVSRLFDTTRDGYYRLELSIDGFAPHERVQFSVDEVDHRGEAAAAALRRRLVASGLLVAGSVLVLLVLRARRAGAPQG